MTTSEERKTRRPEREEWFILVAGTLSIFISFLNHNVLSGGFWTLVKIILLAGVIESAWSMGARRARR